MSAPLFRFIHDHPWAVTAGVGLFDVLIWGAILISILRPVWQRWRDSRAQRRYWRDVRRSLRQLSR